MGLVVAVVTAPASASVAAVPPMDYGAQRVIIDGAMLMW